MSQVESAQRFRPNRPRIELLELPELELLVTELALPCLSFLLALPLLKLPAPPRPTWYPEPISTR